MTAFRNCRRICASANQVSRLVVQRQSNLDIFLWISGHVTITSKQLLNKHSTDFYANSVYYYYIFCEKYEKYSFLAIKVNVKKFILRLQLDAQLAAFDYVTTTENKGGGAGGGVGGG